MAEASDPLRGTNYRTLDFIGRGGMGEIVLAEHRGLGNRVVVKLLHERWEGDSSVMRRMEIEARSLAALRSPYVVQVTDFGQTPAGRTYFVMEYLVGRTLGAELKERGELPVDEAIRYTLHVLAGLEAAHTKGIVHRDVKLDNVFVCDGLDGGERSAKLLDFGIAKVIDVAKGVDRPVIPALRTEEGKLVGTPRACAPEQALGKPVDARTDVYATGLLLYTLVAGRGPFAHLRGAADLLLAQATQEPERPSKFAKQRIPAALDAAILKALAKTPEDRYASADAFATALRELSAEWSDDDKETLLLQPTLSARVEEETAETLPAAPSTIAVLPFRATTSSSPSSPPAPARSVVAAGTFARPALSPPGSRSAAPSTPISTTATGEGSRRTRPLLAALFVVMLAACGLFLIAQRQDAPTVATPIVVTVASVDQAALPPPTTSAVVDAATVSSAAATTSAMARTTADASNPPTAAPRRPLSVARKSGVVPNATAAASAPAPPQLAPPPAPTAASHRVFD